MLLFYSKSINHVFFSGKNCTVSTLFDSNEDEMFIFDPKKCQWYEYLSHID